MIVDLLQWVLGAGLLGFFVLLAGINFRIMVWQPRSLEAGQHGPSPVPIVGGLLGMMGLLTVPAAELRGWAWLPLLLDPGTGLYLAYVAWALWRERGRPAAPPPAEPTGLAERRRAIGGCLLGTAVADALGLPFEGLSRRRLARWLRGPLRHRFFLWHGFCSDDTEHSCLVGQALLTARTLPQEQYADRFAHNLAWRLRFWLLGLPAGIGLATLRSLVRQWLHPFGTARGVRSAGNGPAMRSALIGVCHGDAPELMRRLVAASTRLTHTDARAEDGALAVALAAQVAAAGGDAMDDFPPRLRALLAEGAMLAGIEKACASAARGESTQAFAAAIGCADGVSGFVLHSVPVALHAWFRHPADYAAAVEAVIRCGGDTDTVAAIVGGIVGARVGPEGIPPAWRDGLWEWPRTRAWMLELAERLADEQPEHAWHGALPLSLTALLLRNVLFLAWVLLLGLRRLLPPY